MIWRDRGTLLAGGRRLEYACFGPAPQDAPTLVMLHEGLGCVDLWRNWPARLSALTGWGALVYSRAGYGQSEELPLPWPLDYMARHACDVLPDVLAPLSRFVLLGHSDGATIAAIYAGLCPDSRLAGSLLIAPHFFTEPEGLAAISKARLAFDKGDLRARLSRYHSDVDCAFNGWCNSWLDPDFKDWSITGCLPNIVSPVCVIQGSQDPYGTEKQVEAVSAMCPGARTPLLISGCGHAPHLEAPQPVEEEVLSFLGSL